MSTRANIIIKDSSGDHLFFYRHSDGYPDGALPVLKIFLRWLKEGKVRDNVGQSAGWLVVLGAIEYGTIPSFEKEVVRNQYSRPYGKLSSIDKPNEPTYGWKVGAIEPTNCIHGDVEFLYIIDLENKKIDSVSIQDNWEESEVIESWTE